MVELLMRRRLDGAKPRPVRAAQATTEVCTGESWEEMGRRAQRYIKERQEHQDSFDAHPQQSLPNPAPMFWLCQRSRVAG